MARKWSPEDAGSMAFVMIDVPSAPAAEFLAKYLESYQLVTQKIPVAYRHITRFIPQSKLNGMIASSMKKNESNIDMKALIFKGIVEGMEQRGGKRRQQAVWSMGG
ncbi:MAG: hypothetical protein WDN75_00945 [Bacteroidota bacterium]